MERDDDRNLPENHGAGPGPWRLGGHGGGDAGQRYLQTALTGTGYFFVAYLVHQLAARLISNGWPVPV